MVHVMVRKTAASTAPVSTDPRRFHRPCRHRLRATGRTPPLFTHRVTHDNDVTVSSQKGAEQSDLAAAEKAEQSIDAFILKRARDSEEQRRVEADWAESERRVVEKRRREHRESWLLFHESMHKTHLGIAAEHADRWSRLMAEAGYDLGESPGPEAA